MTLPAVSTFKSTPLDLFKKFAPSKFSDAEFEKVASASNYLPYLTHLTIASGKVKKGQAESEYYLTVGKDNNVPMGKDIVVIPVAWRFKALDNSGPKPISSLDPESATFQSIAARANDADSRCQAGPEFLLWIPALAKFATYLMSNRTARREAVQVKEFLKRPIEIRTKTYAEFGPIRGADVVVRIDEVTSLLDDQEYALMVKSRSA